MGGQDLLFKTIVVDPYGIIVPFIFVGAGGWTKDLMNGKHSPFPPSWTSSPSTSLNFSISVLAPSSLASLGSALALSVALKISQCLSRGHHFHLLILKPLKELYNKSLKYYPTQKNENLLGRKAFDYKSTQTPVAQCQAY